MTNEWILEHGCHNETLISKDTACQEEHGSRDAAYNSYLKHREFYHSIGYKIWFANIIHPDGKKEILELNSYR